MSNVIPLLKLLWTPGRPWDCPTKFTLWTQLVSLSVYKSLTTPVLSSIYFLALYTYYWTRMILVKMFWYHLAGIEWWICLSAPLWFVSTCSTVYTFRAHRHVDDLRYFLAYAALPSVTLSLLDNELVTTCPIIDAVVLKPKAITILTDWY